MSKLGISRIVSLFEYASILGIVTLRSTIRAIFSGILHQSCIIGLPIEVLDSINMPNRHHKFHREKCLHIRLQFNRRLRDNDSFLIAHLTISAISLLRIISWNWKKFVWLSRRPTAIFLRGNLVEIWVYVLMNHRVSLLNESYVDNCWSLIFVVKQKYTMMISLHLFYKQSISL